VKRDEYVIAMQPISSRKKKTPSTMAAMAPGLR
jgi:hypothetical protein